MTGRRVGLLFCFTAASFAGPPETRVGPVTEVFGGRAITDPYRWLEDQNSPETRAWIKAQMSYTLSASAFVVDVRPRFRIRK